MSSSKDLENTGLEQLGIKELVEEYQQLFGKTPRAKNRQFLIKRIRWKLEEQRLGGLSKVAKKNLEVLMSGIEVPIGSEKGTKKVKSNTANKGAEFQPGTILTRVYMGRTIEVLVTDTGFEYEGQLYKSLSAIANKVTGSKWNGRLFFGLTKRKDRKMFENKLNENTTEIKVAIYTRQSLADDKEFDSLEAQREAIETYIKSQPNWSALPDHYDDSGFSGGNTDRPAFQRLLTDIKSGKIEIVAIYKLDRLSRSITDFVLLSNFFEEHNVRLVSITQAFDTSNSLGRMTVHLLATFSTYEREMISERTKDKMVAARRRGLWTGGPPPLGYDIKDGKLVINKKEAEQIREIFNLYLSLNSFTPILEEVRRLGYKTKSWVLKNGNRRPGKDFNKQSLSNLLKNPVYIGKLRVRDGLVNGVHEAIMDEQIWNTVQNLLASRKPGRQKRLKTSAVLQGLIRCAYCGELYVPHYARRGNKKYSAYVCSTYQKQGAKACPKSRIPMAELDRYVLSQIEFLGLNPDMICETAKSAKEKLKVRQPEIEIEIGELEKQITDLSSEKTNIIKAIGKSEACDDSLLKRLGEIDLELSKLDEKQSLLEAELHSLDTQVIDKDELKQVLNEFTPLWDQLTLSERQEIVRLLIKEIRYKGSEGEIEIDFNPEGIKLLSKNTESKETA